MVGRGLLALTLLAAGCNDAAPPASPSSPRAQALRASHDKQRPRRPVRTVEQAARLADGAPLDDSAELTRRGRTPGESVARAGSRLKPLYLRTPGGIPHFVGQRDTQLDTQCWFGTDRNGQLRCMPGFSHWPEFLDATCSTQPVMSPWANEAVPAPGEYKTVFYVDELGNETSQAPFRVTGNVTTRKHYELWGDSCEEVETQLDNTYYTLEPIAIEDLVTGESKLIKIGGSRIFADMIAGSDGSRTGATGYFDRRLRTWVTPIVTRDRGQNEGVLAWVPSDPDPHDIYPAFADASCTTNAAAFSSASEPNAAAAIPGTPRLNASCDGYTIPLRRLGARLEESYLAEGGTCELDTYGLPTYSLGGPASAQAYVKARIDLRGRQRLAARTVVGDDGSVAWEGVHYMPYYDRELDVNCSVSPQPEGYSVCLPFSDYTAPLTTDESYPGYLDADCTQEVLVASGLQNEACYEGSVRNYRFSYADDLHVTRQAGSTRVADEPVPVYHAYTSDGVRHCDPQGDAFAYAIDSTEVLDVAVSAPPSE